VTATPPAGAPTGAPAGWRHDPSPSARRQDHPVSRDLALTVVGAVLVALGVLFTLQGVGLVGGSPMTGDPFWAAAGPVIALVGLYLAVVRRVGRRRR